MKRFIKQFITLVALTAIIPNYAIADSCKDIKESKDSFSGEITQNGQSNIGPLMWNWILGLSKKNNKYSITTQIVLSGDVRTKMLQGEKILVKLENDKIVELVLEKDVIPVANVSGTSVFTVWISNTEVDEATIKSLAKNSITAVKVTIGGTDTILEKDKIKEKQTLNIMNMANCLLGM